MPARDYLVGPYSPKPGESMINRVFSRVARFAESADAS